MTTRGLDETDEPQDGCEACGSPEAEYLITYGLWITAYCERCAQQLVRDGQRLDRTSRPLPETPKPTQRRLWEHHETDA